MQREIKYTKTLICLLVCFLQFSCYFEMFDESPKKIDEINLGKNYAKLFVYKSESNATTNESIQIRAEKDIENAIAIFERYDLLISSDLIGNNLQVVLKDTSGYKSKIDTMYINVKDIPSYP